MHKTKVQNSFLTPDSEISCIPSYLVRLQLIRDWLKSKKKLVGRSKSGKKCEMSRRPILMMQWRCSSWGAGLWIRCHIYLQPESSPISGPIVPIYRQYIDKSLKSPDSLFDEKRMMVVCKRETKMCKSLKDQKCRRLFIQFFPFMPAPPASCEGGIMKREYHHFEQVRRRK